MMTKWPSSKLDMVSYDGMDLFGGFDNRLLREACSYGSLVRWDVQAKHCPPVSIADRRHRV